MLYAWVVDKSEKRRAQADQIWGNVMRALEDRFEGQGRSGEIGIKWLAVNSGIHDSTIHNGIKRHTIPKADTLRKFAEVLCVPLHHLDPSAEVEVLIDRPHQDAVYAAWDLLDPAEILRWVDLAQVVIKSRSTLDK